MNALQQIDGNILLWIQEHLRVSFLDNFWKGITFLGNGGWFWIVLTIALLCFKKTRPVGIAAAMALLINVLLTNVLLKNLVARTRPFDAISAIVPLIKKPLDYSFPSGHTAASFACAFVGYRMLDRKYGVTMLVLAGLIAFSRLYLGVHYPTDVLGGLVVGIVAGIASCLIYKKYLEKRIPLSGKQ